MSSRRNPGRRRRLTRRRIIVALTLLFICLVALIVAASLNLVKASSISSLALTATVLFGVGSFILSWLNYRDTLIDTATAELQACWNRLKSASGVGHYAAALFTWSRDLPSSHSQLQRELADCERTLYELQPTPCTGQDDVKAWNKERYKEFIEIIEYCWEAVKRAPGTVELQDKLRIHLRKSLDRELIKAFHSWESQCYRLRSAANYDRRTLELIDSAQTFVKYWWILALGLPPHDQKRQDAFDRAELPMNQIDTRIFGADSSSA